MLRISSSLVSALFAVLALTAVACAAAGELSIPAGDGWSIDGQISEAERNAAYELPLPNKLYVKTGGEDDISATAYLMWSREAIYLGVEVEDDNVIFETEEDDPVGKNDAVELWIQQTRFSTALRKDGRPAVRAVNLANWDRPEIGKEHFAIRKNSAGYVVEMEVPAVIVQQCTGQTPVSREQLLIAIGVKDTDDPDDDAVDKLYYPAVYGWNNLEGFALLTLE